MCVEVSSKASCMCICVANEMSADELFMKLLSERVKIKIQMTVVLRHMVYWRWCVVTQWIVLRHDVKCARKRRTNRTRKKTFAWAGDCIRIENALLLCFYQYICLELLVYLGLNWCNNNIFVRPVCTTAYMLPSTMIWENRVFIFFLSLSLFPAQMLEIFFRLYVWNILGNV